ncbi:MAG: bifunctional molybdopterin-guanine dinucleotide biosynthesis adaptor protein MobB/molybdopterin molybdotransferase MoeA [Vibrio sp.]
MQQALVDCPVPVLGFAAYSGTGKTTLLEQLLPKLTQAGLKIGMFKHAHHAFDVDKPGKDSYRLRKAGASQMLIASRNRHVLMTETPEAEAQFVDLIHHFDHSKLDLILVEGCKNLNFAKIELHRKALEKPWLYPFDPNIIAVACDQAKLPVSTELPHLDLNDLDAMADFVKAWIQNKNKPSQANLNTTPLAAKTAPSETPATSSTPASCDTLSPAFLSVEQGRQHILDALKAPQATTQCDLNAAYQSVLADDIYSPVNVPAYTNSAMDGFAVRAQDFNCARGETIELTCVDTIYAGHASHKTLAANQCMKIMTGAPMPQGADTVIMREQAIETDASVRFEASILPLKQGQNVRQAGEDLAKDGLVFAKGTRLLSAQMGMIASLGFAKVTLFKPLTVAIFSTGNEVQAPGQPLTEASIYDANRFSLTGQLQRLGCKVLDLGIIEDSQTAIESALQHAASEADLVLSSGGVSVGDADFIKDALNKLGEINFWRINMRPGRPLAFGHLNQTPFFGLPGNPVATLIAFLAFVEPAIRQLQGETHWQPAVLTAIASENLRSRLGRTEFSRGFYHVNNQGQLEVASTGSQGSGILRSMHEANCIIEIAPHIEQVKAGEMVHIIPLQGRM